MRVIEQPEVASRGGKPVFGPYFRRLFSVKEVAALEGVSLNRAQALRRERPLAYLADFPGQEALATLLRKVA